MRFVETVGRFFKPKDSRVSLARLRALVRKLPVEELEELASGETRLPELQQAAKAELQSPALLDRDQWQRDD